MSRSYRFYDEDWQRRKSILIRSLFHDIPILSPVTEESNESIDIIQPRETSDVPPRIFDAPSRHYSPLPPLIIEREPDRHDEPEEYYRTLLTKIKKIYKKLFIDNMDLSSEDYNLSHYYSSNNEDDLIENVELDDMNVDLNLTENGLQNNVETDSTNESIQEGIDSTNSTGYRADFESNTLSDVQCNSEMFDEGAEEEEYVNVTHITNEHEESNDNKKSTSVTVNSQEINENEESTNVGFENLDTSETETPKTIEIDDRQTNVAEESYKAGSDSSNDEDHEIIDTEESHSESMEDEPYNIKVVDQDKTVYEESNNVKNKGKDSIENAESQANDPDAIVKESVLKSQESASNENELTLIHAEEMEDVESSVSKEGIDYRQITTEALIHVDGSQDVTERESRVYEDSVRSVILPGRVKRLKETQEVDDRIEVYAVLEENEDPETVRTYDTDVSEPISEVEVMRTPRPESAIEYVPNIRCSDLDVTNEHTALPQELSNATSTPQYGNDDTNQNISDLQASYENCDIFTSIFDVSHHTSPLYEPFKRKRKLYKDISIQTSEAPNWDDFKGNLFVGAPKVSKLCSCDHICDYLL